ncbi:hypothetical protein [Dysgonomonas sp. 520]|uniref:hypothetical protein n=1 Tax=Dysgonomonas sp. 520 TaxID=2302931 RepID=UPI0013D01273|nr:hypothetical protein [Dysgonomonas sp. 520]NDW09158.1 hypothetical protein [Dysgonomonas sp. 520]
MKKNILILFMFLAVTTLKAQVGVNTENPQGIFHIDGQRNTSGNTNFSDDVVVDTQGRIGVGTNSPQTKVDIKAATAGTGFRLQDGTQGNGKILTSDANGNGSWAANGIQTVLPVWSLSLDSISIEKKGVSTGTTITLPPGKWWIHGSFLVKFNKLNEISYFVRSSFTDGVIPVGTENCPVTTDIVQRCHISGAVGLKADFSLIGGGITLDNQTNSTKTYTVTMELVSGTSKPLENLKFIRFAQGLWGEDNMIAIKIQD